MLNGSLNPPHLSTPRPQKTSYSLAPGRSHATMPVALCHQLVRKRGRIADPWHCRPALERIASALHQAFPNNIFGDMDFLAADLWQQNGSPSRSGSHDIEHLSETIIKLMRLYGAQSAIRFRYVHDFLYGFDWSRWVRRQPAKRQHCSPFSPDFLNHLHNRAKEILQLITYLDPKCPKMDTHQWRNAFDFSRSSTDEIRLYRDLAVRGLLPINAWDPTDRPRWQLDYHLLRQQRARTLGITLHSI